MTNVEVVYNGASTDQIQWEAYAAPLRERITALEALCERLKLEAQGHAQEAQTANATIAEIYQVCSGRTGEPGNWHGAEPVRERITALEAELHEINNPHGWFANVDASIRVQRDVAMKRAETAEAENKSLRDALLEISDSCDPEYMGELARKALAGKTASGPS
jgi:hypothetical protein